MAARMDLTGRTFGRWTVVQTVPSAGGGAKTLTRKHRPTSSCGCTYLKPSAPTPPPTADVAPARPEPSHTISAEEVRAFREKHAPQPSKYRRVAWSVDEDDQAGGVLSDFDPFDR